MFAVILLYFEQNSYRTYMLTKRTNIWKKTKISVVYTQKFIIKKILKRECVQLVAEGIFF